MPNDTATLTIGTTDVTVRFDWMRYDGDDCFGQHTIEYTDNDGSQRFDFGACAVRCVRKIESLLNSDTDSVGFGFRVPEIIDYNLDRINDSLRLHVYSDELAIDATMIIPFTDAVFDKPFRRFYTSK